MNAFDDNGRGRNKEEGSLTGEMEVDSDVYEDQNREKQLDDSFEDWYRNIGHWVEQKEDMTQVPKDNVFEAATELDAEQE
ncbi:hypothetical protein [Paenibacillus caui]|uniref:hypothetical protein n=1 Tax=Paenibacillus caui TaxID=2873927 RepID=UPI001CA94E5A|nr:hypothetical protein [Paenibacillus caui]